MSRLVSRWMLLGLLAAVLGCNSLRDPGDITPDSLLQAAQSSASALSVDIYWARTIPSGPEWHDQLWESVQEDRVPVETRRALAENGLRAGVVGGNPNPMIAHLLDPHPDVSEEERAQTMLSGMSKVSRRQLTLRPGQRGEIQSTDAAGDCTIIRRREGQLTGRPYQSAQGLYALEMSRKEGDRIEVQLVPEVQHGQPKMQFTSVGPGIVAQRPGRDVDVFDELRTQVSLTSGEMLVVAPLVDSGSKLGGLFHTCQGPEGPQQKILLIRLSQVPKSDLLARRDASWPWD